MWDARSTAQVAPSGALRLSPEDRQFSLAKPLF
jgi:hypothetical protein